MGLVLRVFKWDFFGFGRASASGDLERFTLFLGSFQGVYSSKLVYITNRFEVAIRGN